MNPIYLVSFECFYRNSGANPTNEVGVYGYCKDGAGVFLDGVAVGLSIQTGRDKDHLSTATNSATTNADGYFEVNLGKLKGAQETIIANLISATKAGFDGLAEGQDTLAVGTFQK